MTEEERVIWDKAFEVAYKACMDHVSFAHKGEYSYEVGKAFVNSIKRAKIKAEKAISDGQDKQ